jgi:transcriptional regulator with XRE-family HTH domain
MISSHLRRPERMSNIAVMRTPMAPVERHHKQTLGHMLRQWRSERGLSQLELALRAGFSSRHISFIETGRTQASRQAVVVLAEALDVPLRERNCLLEAAGYAHLYRHTPLAAEEMTQVRSVLQFLLKRHEPYAAIVLDRYSNCLMGNKASGRMVAALVDKSLITEHANHLRLVFHPLGARRWIVNWDEVAKHLLTRAERDFGQASDEAGTALLVELRRYAPELTAAPPKATLEPAELLLPIRIKRGDLELRLFSTIMTLGTPQDVTLQELRLETFFPADGESETAWTWLLSTASQRVDAGDA